MGKKSKGSVPQYKRKPKIKTIDTDEVFKKYFDTPKFEVTKEKGFVQNYKNGGIVNFKGTF
tara:strand:- start:319 stop:501 length:183 start_codon:yes stop_codon:yes gene_type:complete